MPGCSAFGCSNRSEHGYLMKAFPRDPIRRQQWAIQTKRANWTPTENSVLCEVHFEDGMWEKTRADGSRKLKCNAIPTLFNFTTNKPKRKVSRYLLPSTSSSTVSSNINTVQTLFNHTENRTKKKDLLPNIESSSSNIVSSNINPVSIVQDTSMDILIPETSSVSISQMKSPGSSNNWPIFEL
ncbi:hypothetical protein ILUMI_11684 [Ignelater luminosus]|uniref:THAP-type domain-containing protein n=1 Tax=Ignelater luminosus TaxID=2038154 RepID=A0A8K0CXY4_IGNLU|nr:hypothetical protein ILUMI_11684 [Ignelater luminosus]